MNRHLQYASILGWCICFLATSLAVADDPPAKPEAKPAPEKDKEKASRYVRVRRNDADDLQALETSIIRFAPGDGAAKWPGVDVDLIGAIHIGDKAYYEQLNREFTNYEVVLYELVAGDGEVPRPGQKRRDAHPVSAMQRTMQRMLELNFQLDDIDYTKKNFVHADMSPKEFADSMAKRGESFWQVLFRMMGRAAAAPEASNAKGNEFDLLFAFFAKDRALKLKRALADQLADLETQIDIFEGPEGSTLITERNKKALEVLERELKAGRKRIAIFYGAGHFPDMETRLVEQFGLERKSERWLTAWSLTRPAEPAAPKKDASREP